MLKFNFDGESFSDSVILLNLFTNIYNCWLIFTTLHKSRTYLHANMLIFIILNKKVFISKICKILYIKA